MPIAGYNFLSLQFESIGREIQCLNCDIQTREFISLFALYIFGLGQYSPFMEQVASGQSKTA